MQDQDKTKAQLIEELAQVRQQLVEVQEELEESEQEAALILQTALLGIHGCDTEGRITFVNPAYEQITGRTAEELLGTFIWDLIEPGLQKESLPAYLKHLVSQQPPPTPFIARNIRKNGEVFDVRVDWSYKRNPQGQVIGFVSVVTDITEERKAQAALQESEERYRTLAESTTDVIYILDETGRLLYANRTAAAYFGVSPEALVGKTQEDLFPPEQVPGHLEHIRKVFETGEVQEAETLYRFGPQEVWLSVRTIPLRDNQGRITSLMGVCRDITERKQAEHILRKAHDELEEKVKERTSELRTANEELDIFRRFAETSSQGFGMADMDGLITYLNPALCRLAGVARPEDVIGKPLTMFYPEEYRQRRETEVIPALLREGHWEGEIVNSLGGKVITVLQHSFLIRDENGNPSHLASVLTDITERKQAEEALRKSEQRFRSYFEQGLMGMAVSTVRKRWSEINNRLCEILGYSREELLQLKWTEVTHPDDLEPGLFQFNRMVAGEVDQYTQEKRFLRKDGELVYATVFIRCFRRSDGAIEHILALIEDTTERKQAQETLQKEHRTLKHLLQSSDHERQTIAYEIHDGLTQQLAGAIMQFQTFDHLKETKAKQATKAFDAGMTMLQQGHFEARRLIAGVRPPVLDESGVLAAISHLVNEQRRLKSPKIEYRSRADFDRLDPILENAIYRIAQEGLENACVHSKSEKVRVSLVQREDRIRIEIRDWGIGFDTKAVQQNRFGLEGIRQRTRLLVGKCSIRSVIGTGTRIAVELPVVLRDADQ